MNKAKKDGLIMYFQELRFNPNHHLGMGDIRITIGQQEEICKEWSDQIKKRMLVQIQFDKQQEKVNEIFWKLFKKDYGRTLKNTLEFYQKLSGD